VIAFLDTHALVALGNAKLARFGSASRRILDTADLRVSPIVLLELHVLREINRLSVDPDRFYAQALEECGIEESSDPIAAVVRASTSLAWTRDPFDRLIVGAAILHRGKLVTKDLNIHEHFDGAVW
jgi:PIN domain nuclease of toxin-antitoxin system